MMTARVPIWSSTYTASIVRFSGPIGVRSCDRLTSTSRPSRSSSTSATPSRSSPTHPAPPAAPTGPVVTEEERELVENLELLQNYDLLRTLELVGENGSPLIEEKK